MIATYAGVAGDPFQSPEEVEDMATVLERSPVDTVSTSRPIVVQVIPPVPNGQMVRVHTPTVMAAMSDDLISVGG